jgi:AcrR family transcriptional regulator
MGRAQFDHTGFLAAARAIAAERGPAAVTVDSISERLKAPKGSFYYRFASRDALLGELWLTTVLAYQEGFVAEMTLATVWARRSTHPPGCACIWMMRGCFCSIAATISCRAIGLQPSNAAYALKPSDLRGA